MVNISSLHDSDSSMASWVRGRCLGKGSFGTVTIGVSKSDGRVFAVKSVDLHSGQVAALDNEIRILRSMSSPYVVSVLGDDATTSYRNLYLEYLPGGTLADLASRQNGGRYADVERVVRYFTWCVVNALRYVHARGVVHCDVKGRNVLVGLNGGVAKLADFGSAVERYSSDAVAVDMVPRGSPLWMAPEVIRRESQGPESDVWSLGCTVIEMVTGKPGWDDDDGFNTLSRIGYSDELPEFPSQLSELGRDFLGRCLSREPSERWSCDQLLQHPFLLPTSPNKLEDLSPRCILDWINSDEFKEEDEEETRMNNETSANERIGKLASNSRVNWEVEDDWLEVRALGSNRESTVPVTSGREDEDEGTSSEYEDLRRAEKEIELGISRELKMGKANAGIWNWVEDHSENDRRYAYGQHKLDLLRKTRAITFIYSLWCYCWCSLILKINYLFQVHLNILLYPSLSFIQFKCFGLYTATFNL